MPSLGFADDERATAGPIRGIVPGEVAGRIALSGAVMDEILLLL